jgi:hypothetical protein
MRERRLESSTPPVTRFSFESGVRTDRRHGSGGLDCLSRSGEEPGTRTTRFFWVTFILMAEGLPTIALGSWNFWCRSVRPHAAHSLGRPAINANARRTEGDQRYCSPTRSAQYLLYSFFLCILWSVFGSTFAFGYSALLFIAGAVLVTRIR